MLHLKRLSLGVLLFKRPPASENQITTYYFHFHIARFYAGKVGFENKGVFGFIEIPPRDSSLGSLSKHPTRVS